MNFLLNKNDLPLNDFVIEPNHVTFKSQLCSACQWIFFDAGLHDYGVQLHTSNVNAPAIH